MRRIGFALATLLVMLAAQARGEPFDTGSWPCNGQRYESNMFIYEAAFPGSHPGFSTITQIDLATKLIKVRKRKRATTEFEAILVNRRGNRPHGFSQLLFYVASDQDTSLLNMPTRTHLIDGDVGKLFVTCTPIGKPPKRDSRVNYTVEFTGNKENGYEE